MAIGVVSLALDEVEEVLAAALEVLVHVDHDLDGTVLLVEAVHIELPLKSTEIRIAEVLKHHFVLKPRLRGDFEGLAIRRPVDAIAVLA